MREYEIKNTAIRWPQYLAGLAGAGGAFASGTALGWPAPAGPRLVGEADRYFPLTQSQFDWVASVITIGLAFSCLPIGYLMNAFGRKRMMLVLVLPFLIGWAFVIWAQNFVMLLMGRFILGLAGGCFCISAPQYSTEIAEKEIRGILGSFFQVLIIAGILFVYVVGAYVPIFWTNVICSIFPLVYGSFLIPMPESPVFYMMKNREEDAIKSIKWLRGDNFDPMFEITNLKSELRIDYNTPKISIANAFSQPNAIWSVVVVMGMITVQQFSGISVILFFATNIFIAAGTNLSADISTIIIGTVNLLATIVGSLLVDRAGRRILLLVSVSVMTLSLGALGSFFFVRDLDPELAENLGWLPLTSLSVFIIAFALGFGPIPWLMISELYSKDINYIASPVTGFINPCLTFLVSSTFTTLTKSIGVGETFWIYAGCCFVGIFYVFFLVPETKGKSLSEIQVMLAKKQT